MGVSATIHITGNKDAAIKAESIFVPANRAWSYFLALGDGPYQDDVCIWCDPDQLIALRDQLSEFIAQRVDA